MTRPYKNYQYTDPYTLEVEVVFRKRAKVRAFSKKHALEIIERRIKNRNDLKRAGFELLIVDLVED